MNQNESEKSLLEDYHEEIMSMEGYDKPVKQARTILFILAGLQLVPIFFNKGDMSEDESLINTVVCIVVAVIFAALGFWTKRKPFTAILIALIVYGSLVLLSAIFDPSTLMQGVFLKIIAFGSLGVALSNARDVQKWMDTMKKNKMN